MKRPALAVELPPAREASPDTIEGAAALVARMSPEERLEWAEKKKAELAALRDSTLRGPRFRQGTGKGLASATFGPSYLESLKLATGIADVDAAEALLSNVARSSEASSPLVGMNQTAALMAALAPQDPLEGVLVAQMVAVHGMVMRFSAGAMHPENDAVQIDRFTERVNKLSRTFTAQVEALARLRGKGPSEQRVIVQHVSVNEGGQAIVGNVSKGGERGST